MKPTAPLAVRSKGIAHRSLPRPVESFIEIVTVKLQGRKVSSGYAQAAQRAQLAGGLAQATLGLRDREPDKLVQCERRHTVGALVFLARRLPALST